TPGVEEVAHIIRIGDPWGGYDLAPVWVGHITAPHSSQGRGMKLPFQGTHVQPWAPALIITIADTVGINGETGTKIRSLIVTVAPLAKLILEFGKTEQAFHRSPRSNTDPKARIPFPGFCSNQNNTVSGPGTI